MSIKKGIVADELIIERAKCAIDQKELQTLFYANQETFDLIMRSMKDQADDPEFGKTHKYNEMTREEVQLDWMRKLHHAFKTKDRKMYF